MDESGGKKYQAPMKVYPTNFVMLVFPHNLFLATPPVAR